MWSDRKETENLSENKRVEMDMHCITCKNDHVNCPF